MTKAFAYMRVSGKGQEAGDGFDRQRIAIERYAKANDITIAGWYQDTQTGKDEWQDRPGWSSMMLQMNGLRTIIVEKLDRVARAVLVQELILQDLGKREVRLVSTTGDDTDDSTPERQLFRVILAGFAAYERQSITLKLRGARDRKKAATGRCEGRKPYGEHPKHPEETATIKRMIELRTAGETFDAIARALNSEGIRPRGTKRGPGRWFGATVQNILERINS